MPDYFFRTEDIRPEEVLEYFVETKQDRTIVDALKNRNPTLLVGSRGVGKSFLLRVAQRELLDSFDKDRVFPIYVSFVRSSLLQSSDPDQFKHWMLARICSAIVRSLGKAGLLGRMPKGVSLLAGADLKADIGVTRIETIAEAYESSWRSPNTAVDITGLPAVEELRDALEDLSDDLDIKRFVLLVDEASHIFLPEQQRQFFTLFRDLRSHCVTCNAAVYPGVTSYGDTFQPVHDATTLFVERDVLASDYIDNMREMVQKQADSGVLTAIAQNGKNFAVLAYAATGNPRLLLKTLARAPKVNSTQVNETIREFYRTDVWAEHSLLSEKYLGHKELIDWGRTFIESYVLPELRSKNDANLRSEKKSSAFFWVHRDAPEMVKESLRILAYTGIVSEHANGIKASRGEIGKRFLVNLGCVFAQESTPASSAFEIAKALDPRRMTEYGANRSEYRDLLEIVPAAAANAASVANALQQQLTKPIAVLDLTDWQKDKLVELNLSTVGDVLNATEEKLKEAMYVGDVRARRMRNAAVAAVMEYLSG